MKLMSTSPEDIRAIASRFTTYLCPKPVGHGYCQFLTKEASMSTLVATLSPVTWYCDDIHTGANSDVYFGFPTVPEGWFYLGQVAVPQHQGFTQFFSIIVREVGPADFKPKIQQPNFIVPKWEKTGYGGMCVVSYLCNDIDYIPLGDLYVRNYAANVSPSTFPQLACVRRDLLMAATYETSNVWNDQGSGAQDNVSLWSDSDSNLVWFGDTEPRPDENH